GSGPAFVYAMIEALAHGGEKMGLTKQSALRLAAQTALGASDLMITSEKSPADLIKMVVSPGGTTAAGLRVMDERGIADAIAAAVKAATERGQEMARENLYPSRSVAQASCLWFQRASRPSHERQGGRGRPSVPDPPL